MKLLSILICGRNDDYMGNYRYRLTTAIHYLVRNLERAGVLERCEILIGDWNSEVPLSKALELSSPARSIARFVHTPPPLAVKAMQPGQKFHNSLAINTAIRRAEGKFLMVTDSDALISLHSVKAIFDLVGGVTPLPLDIERAFFIADRRHVPWEVVQRGPSLADIDTYLLLHGGDLPCDAGLPGLGICQNAWLAHRSVWQHCRGFHEQLHYWGWTDADLTLRVTQEYPWIQLSSLGVSIFHMEHWPCNRRSSPTLRNSHIVCREVAGNDAAWGLGAQSLAIQSSPGPAAISVPDAAIPDPASARPPSLPGVPVEFDDAEIAKLVRSATRKLPVEATETGALKALAWHALRQSPRTYVEFGIADGYYAAALVASACPSTDIFGIDSWERPPQGHQPMPATHRDALPPPDYAANALKRAACVGYVRFVTGDLATAFTRLKLSFVGPLSLELVLLRQGLFGTAAPKILAEVLPHIAPNGLLVTTGADAAALESLAHLLLDAAKQKNGTFIRSDPHTGLFFGPAFAKAADTGCQAGGLGQRRTLGSKPAWWKWISPSRTPSRS